MKWSMRYERDVNIKSIYMSKWASVCISLWSPRKADPVAISWYDDAAIVAHLSFTSFGSFFPPNHLKCHPRRILIIIVTLIEDLWCTRYAKLSYEVSTLWMPILKYVNYSSQSFSNLPTSQSQEVMALAFTWKRFDSRTGVVKLFL